MADSTQSQLELFERRIERERKARKAAEKVIEEKSRELYDANQNLIKFAEDLEEQVKIRTAEYKDALKAAEAANQAKSSFLANMSHEIRTPLNGVLGILYLLKNDLLTQEQKRQLSIALSCSESLLKIINDILDFSKVEAGKLELESIKFSLIELLEDTAQSHILKADEKHLELIVDVSEIPPVYLRGDPSRLRQILTNLLSNAIKFTNQGEIQLTAKLIKIRDNLCQLECQIIDTGIGIEDDKLKTLFSTFNQADASTTRQYGGTGLGLAISKKLCEMMNGEIQARSDVGQGSCFEIKIPFETSGSDKSKLHRFQPPPIKALLIESNESQQQATAKLFKHHQLDLTLVSSGLQAIHILNSSLDEPNPDTTLILIDSNISDIEITELIQSLKQIDDLKLFKLVYLSNLASNKLERLFHAGLSAAIHKPLTPQLVNALLIALFASSDVKLMSENQLAHKSLFLPEQAQANSEQNRLAYELEGARVLVVDDCHINQIVIVKQLNQYGVNCELANNGFEALHALEASAKTSKFDLVLLDCQMPEMDGYETARKIRQGAAGESMQNIPIIAVTANAFKENKNKCLSVGMNAYITKPLQPDELISTISKWLVNKNQSMLKSYIDIELLEQFLATIESQLTEFDVEVEASIKHLKKYRLPAAVLNGIEKVESLLNQYDFENALASFKTLRANSLGVKHDA